ncbi:MAG: glycosyltransferase [Clostridiales bacterium]|jgi:glycosyltransferase involved in cell wall biosynthesis|nr:glycosyltransferase [Clostridiales bacterium]
MNEISLCMIAKNEENYLGACLDSIKDAVDEINIVDTGSTDNTIEIAKRYTDRIFHFDWTGSFADARNFSFEQATKDYVMWLDADDTLSPEGAWKLKHVPALLSEEVKYIVMPYYYYFDAQGDPILISYRARLIRRDCGIRWEGYIHEYLPLINASGGCSLDIPVLHTRQDFKYSRERNFKLIQQRINDGEAVAKDYFYHGMMLMGIHAYEDGMKSLLKFDELIGDNIPVNFGYAYLLMYDYYLAQGMYKNAWNVLANHEQSFVGRADYYTMLGTYKRDIDKDTDAAIDYYERALKCPNTQKTPAFIHAKVHRQYLYFMPLIGLGSCYLKKAEFTKALEYYIKALENNPANKDVYDMVRVIKEADKLKKAIDIVAV